MLGCLSKAPPDRSVFNVSDYIIQHMYLSDPVELGRRWRVVQREMEAYSEEVQRWLRLFAACPLSITISSIYEDDCHQPVRRHYAVI